jgi:hypothetical protein
MLNIKDFVIDQLLLRQVKRELKRIAQEDEDEPSHIAPSGSRREPENLDDSDDEDIGPQASRRATLQKIKMEKARSQGLDGTLSQQSEPDEDEDDDESMEM